MKTAILVSYCVQASTFPGRVCLHREQSSHVNTLLRTGREKGLGRAGWSVELGVGAFGGGGGGPGKTREVANTSSRCSVPLSSRLALAQAQWSADCSAVHSPGISWDFLGAPRPPCVSAGCSSSQLGAGMAIERSWGHACLHSPQDEARVEVMCRQRGVPSRPNPPRARSDVRRTPSLCPAPAPATSRPRNSWTHTRTHTHCAGPYGASMTMSRRQNSSCDQCRKGKRACDAVWLRDQRALDAAATTVPEPPQAPASAAISSHGGIL